MDSDPTLLARLIPMRDVVPGEDVYAEGAWRRVDALEVNDHGDGLVVVLDRSTTVAVSGAEVMLTRTVEIVHHRSLVVSDVVWAPGGIVGRPVRHVERLDGHTCTAVFLDVPDAPWTYEHWDGAQQVLVSVPRPPEALAGIR